jgi:hypothetical protein
MLGSLQRILTDGEYVEVDMENAHCELLTGLFPESSAIHMYCSNRAVVLEEVSGATLVPRCTAKQLFIILTFGGNIATGRNEHNIPDAVVLPAICSENKCAVDNTRGKFNFNLDNLIMFVKAAKIK